VKNLILHQIYRIRRAVQPFLTDELVSVEVKPQAGHDRKRVYVRSADRADVAGWLDVGDLVNPLLDGTR
jgi:hypothetical protein